MSLDLVAPISRTPWLVYIRLQLLFVPPRVRFWLILAFQLQLYTKTSSIGQQVILDSETSASLIGCWWGRSGSFSTPDENSSFAIFSKESSSFALSTSLMALRPFYSVHACIRFRGKKPSLRLEVETVKFEIFTSTLYRVDIIKS